MKFDVSRLQMPASPEIQGDVMILRPLERGFGHTLGNTLRRILLSSIPGAAVWAFRVPGVLHEHQTIPGVLEDVHQIIQNLKHLVLVLDDDRDEARLELRVRQPGPVTAGAIASTPGVRIVDPNHYLFELAEERELVFELWVNRGWGFVPAEQHRLPKDAPHDLIRIDALYNPVRRVNFVVEETRVGQRTDFDRLVLEVKTNGAVDVRRAVEYAAKLAIEHLRLLTGERPWVEVAADGEREAASPIPGGSQVPARVRALLSQPIASLEQFFNARTRSTLAKLQIETLRDLLARTEDDLAASGALGRTMLREVKQFLEQHRLRLGVRFEQENGALWWDLSPEEAAAVEEATYAGDTGSTSTAPAPEADGETAAGGEPAPGEDVPPAATKRKRKTT